MKDKQARYDAMKVVNKAKREALILAGMTEEEVEDLAKLPKWAVAAKQVPDGSRRNLGKMTRRQWIKQELEDLRKELFSDGVPLERLRKVDLIVHDLQFGRP